MKIFCAFGAKIRFVGLDFLLSRSVPRLKGRLLRCWVVSSSRGEPRQYGFLVVSFFPFFCCLELAPVGL